MVEETGFGIITAVFTLAGVWITQYYETKKRKSEEKRWYADHFLNRKIESITNHHSLLMDWYFSIRFYGNYPPSTLKEFNDQVQSKADAYLRSLANVSIYLDQDEYLVMTEVLGAFRQATTAIWLSLPDNECPATKASYPSEITNLDWGKFEQAYINAGTLIREHLSPEILKQVPLG